MSLLLMMKSFYVKVKSFKREFLVTVVAHCSFSFQFLANRRFLIWFILKGGAVFMKVNLCKDVKIYTVGPPFVFVCEHTVCTVIRIFLNVMRIY